MWGVHQHLHHRLHHHHRHHLIRFVWRNEACSQSLTNLSSTSNMYQKHWLAKTTSIFFIWLNIISVWTFTPKAAAGVFWGLFGTQHLHGILTDIRSFLLQEQEKKPWGRVVYRRIVLGPLWKAGFSWEFAWFKNSFLVAAYNGVKGFPFPCTGEVYECRARAQHRSTSNLCRWIVNLVSQFSVPNLLSTNVL